MFYRTFGRKVAARTATHGFSGFVGVARPLALACFAMPLIAAHTAQAQSVAPDALSPVVVTATRVSQPVADVLADVSIIDRETIERSGAVGVVDLLGRLPGIEVARNGGPGSVSSVFIRGAESRFTAVYIDGVRVDSQSTGGATWESIPLALIDRIEVVRGPVSAVYGSDALGGVVQLFTRRGQDGHAVPYVQLGAGTHGAYQAQAGVSGVSGMVDYALGVSHTDSDGFHARPIAGQNPDRDGYRSLAGHAKLGLQVNAAHRLEATLLANRLNSDFDSGATSGDRNTHSLQTLGLHWQARWSDNYSTRVSLMDGRSRLESLPFPFQTDTQVRGYLWHNEWRQGSHVLTADLERREDQLQNAPIDQGRSQDALALGYRYSAHGHTLQLFARHDSDSEFGGKGTGSMAYAYAFAPQWRATASVATGFRAPTLFQRFSEFGSASLAPESSRNAELGVRWSQGDSYFSATAYNNRVRNLISFEGAGACASAFGCYANTARAQYRGLTLAGAHRVAGVRWFGSVDFQSPRNRDTDLLLARRAQRHTTFGADTVMGGWTLGAEVQASGRRFDNAANTNKLGGYGVLNLYVSKPVAPGTTVFARLDNVGDRDYQLARTYATSGRTLFVGMKWTGQ